MNNPYTPFSKTDTLSSQEKLQAIRVSHAFATWPAGIDSTMKCSCGKKHTVNVPSTGQVLHVLDDFYKAAYADGKAGRVEEGEAALRGLMEGI